MSIKSCILWLVSILASSWGLQLRMSGNVLDLQKSLFNQINDALNLKTSQAQTFTSNGWKAETEWLDEVKGSKLTGLSKALVQSADGKDSYCYLNGWMGPKYFLPHMLLKVGMNAAGHYCVNADYVPRGPNAFGSDDSYLGTHYGNDVLAWYENAHDRDGSVILPPSKSFAARMLRSPIHVNVGNLSYDDAADIASKHVTRWLSWIAEGRESEARQRGALNGRDDKLRQFAFRAAVSEAAERFGSEVGKDVGAGITGPVAEAYVGGGG